MKRLLKSLRNSRLQVRLSLPVVIALVILLLCQGMLYTVMADRVRDDLYGSTESVTASIRSHMDTRMRSIIERTYYIQLTPAVQEDLTDYLLRQDDATEAVTMSRLSYELPLYRVSEPLISSMLIYTSKQTFTGEGMPTVAGFDFETTSLWEILRNQPGRVVFAPAAEDEIFLMRSRVIPIMLRFSIEGYGGDCVLVVHLSQEKLTSYLREAVPGDGSLVMLLDERGQSVSLFDHPALEELLRSPDLMAALPEAGEYEEVKLAGERYLLSTCQLESSPWRIVYLQAEKESISLLNGLRIGILGTTLTVIVLLLISMNRIVDTVTQPLGRLCQHIRTSENQHKLLDFQYPYQDEIGELAENYNSMVEHIQQLLEEQDQYIRKLEEEKSRADVEQTLKRRAELRALQAQITPHFLYNTLDSIRWKAELAGQEEISRMITALATLFRVGLSRGREIIPVEQEIRHVQSYLMIQKMRYSDRISYVVDVQPEVLKLHTVKLLLQPLVENAIYHGIKESTHSGTVTITGRIQGDAVLLQVTDNGLGILPERLALLQADLARGRSVSREGYGIFNVNERIRLHFGPEYGLTLESRWGEGTVATVRLPRITISEVEKYVSDYDS